MGARRLICLLAGATVLVGAGLLLLDLPGRQPAVGAAGVGAVGVWRSGDGAPASTLPGGRERSVGRTAWMAVVALAVANPPRVRRIAGPVGRVSGGATTAGWDDRPAPARMRRARPPSQRLGGRARLAGTAVGAALALLGGAAVVAVAAFDAVELSAPSVLLGAGLLVALVGLADAVRPPAAVPPIGPGDGAIVPATVPALVRPAGVLLVAAVAGDAGLGAGLAVALAGSLAGLVLVLPPRPPVRATLGRPGRVLDGARLAWAAVAVAGGIDLVVHGALSA